jgi:peroxiredoxin Q/BCP
VALKIGDPAPDFDVTGLQAGETRRLRLADFVGQKNVVLYFYPRDFTPVCTQEACGFRDMYDELSTHDTEVIGVSIDDDASHARFATMHRVKFVLVADTDKALARTYHATSLLRDVLGATKRITYVIDKQGKIAGIFDSQIFARQHLNGVKAVIAKLS